MLRSIFPKAFDNTYVGQRLALWLLAPILFLKLGIGVNSMINARHVAASADSGKRRWRALAHAGASA